MCFGPPATSASSRRRPPSQRLSPPRIAALLHIDKPREREALDRLHGYCTGRRPLWRLLAVRRGPAALLAAVAWVRRRQMFATVSFSFSDGSVCCLFKKSESAARAALVARGEG